MPTYDYECVKCNHIQEEFHKMSESPAFVCEVCKGKMKRIIAVGADYIMTKGKTRGSVQKYKKSSLTPTPTEAAASKAIAQQSEIEHNKSMDKDPYYKFRNGF